MAVSCEQSLWGSKWFVLICLRQHVLPEVAVEDSVVVFADILPLDALHAQDPKRVYSI